jgi:hypothetical protein
MQIYAKCTIEKAVSTDMMRENLQKVFVSNECGEVGNTHLKIESMAMGVAHSGLM